MRVWLATLWLASAMSADAAHYTITCKTGDPPGETYVHRVPRGTYDRSYPACLGVNSSGACTFAFCPSVKFVVGCNLSPTCEVAAYGCSSLDSAGAAFVVRPGHRFRLGRIGRHRVVLRCKRTSLHPDDD